MKKIKINTKYTRMLADTTTPVSIYLRLRDVFPNSLLLESSDYHSRENSMSYVCCEPIGGLTLTGGWLDIKYPFGGQESHGIGGSELISEIDKFLSTFETESPLAKIISNG